MALLPLLLRRPLDSVTGTGARKLLYTPVGIFLKRNIEPRLMLARTLRASIHRRTFVRPSSRSVHPLEGKACQPRWFEPATNVGERGAEGERLKIVIESGMKTSSCGPIILHPAERLCKLQSSSLVVYHNFAHRSKPKLNLGYNASGSDAICLAPVSKN